MIGAFIIVVAALLASMVRPQWYRPIHNGAGTARSDLEEIGAALETYRHDYGRYPTTAQGLDALTRRPGSLPPDSIWYGPYVTSDLPRDPWGHAYEYRETTAGFRLWSNGADGRLGGVGLDSDVILDPGARPN